MLAEEFEKIFEDQVSKCRNVLVTKAKKYAREDRLHNFKQSAHLQGLLVTQALAGKMAKHTVSIYDMIGSGQHYPREVWDEKITDHMNYLFLLQAIIAEDERKITTYNINAPIVGGSAGGGKIKPGTSTQN